MCNVHNSGGHFSLFCYLHESHLIPHLNLLPPYNFGGIDEYFTEFAAVAGGNGRMRFLTYDHYHFTWKVADHNWNDLTVPLDVTFDTVKARYIRIVADSTRPMGVGEIEVYG